MAIQMAVVGRSDLFLDNLKLQVFDKLRNESPELFAKVKAIDANFDAYDLNISEENKTIIWNEVDVRIIYHVIYTLMIAIFLFAFDCPRLHKYNAIDFRCRSCSM